MGDNIDDLDLEQLWLKILAYDTGRELNGYAMINRLGLNIKWGYKVLQVFEAAGMIEFTHNGFKVIKNG